jgi:hypothetical protein
LAQLPKACDDRTLFAAAVFTPGLSLRGLMMPRAIAAAMLAAVCGTAHAEVIQVTGKLGFLAEWEISAKVTESVSSGKAEFSGPLTVRHIGVCTHSGPEEMSGEIRYRITGWIARRMKATLLIDGAKCSFDGKLSRAYDGVISCDRWHGIPLSLLVGSVN